MTSINQEDKSMSREQEGGDGQTEDKHAPE